MDKQYPIKDTHNHVAFENEKTKQNNNKPQKIESTEEKVEAGDRTAPTPVLYLWFCSLQLQFPADIHGLKILNDQSSEINNA